MSEVSGSRSLKANRFLELEGLRGLAALVVVVYHMILMFYPGIAYGNSPTLAPVHNSRIENILYGNPLNVFLSGGFAVAIFFVLSGFVLSIGFFQTGNYSIVKKLASKRYVRLMLPALASVLLACTLLLLGAAVNKPNVVEITHSGSLAGLWGFEPNLLNALWQGVCSIFTSGENSYNPVLWTMKYEFIGSFIIFLTLLVFGKSKYRAVTYGALLLSLLNSWYVGFIFGLILADLYAHRHSVFERLNKGWMYLVLGMGLVIGGYPILSPEGTFYSKFYISMWNTEQNAAFYMSIGAAVVVISVLSLSRLSKVLSMPAVSGLGKYTYSLYLTHLPILLTVCTSFFVLFSRSYGLKRSVALSVILTVPVIISAAWLFEKYIDSPSVKLAGYVSDIYLGKRDLNVKERVLQVRYKLVSTTNIIKMRLVSVLFSRRSVEGEAE
jgi:peptidoglycan/LPS O-acetylase OafA/YrhL